MNFLAHLYLSEPEPLSMLGNMAADFIKGRTRLEALPPAMRRGVRFHRRLDAFTDAHPQTLAACALLRPRWGRYSPILVDVFYDHFLAREWSRFSAEPLREYLDRFYAVLREHRAAAGEEIWPAIERVIGEDWMMTYATVEGIERALARLSRQFTRAEPGLERAVADLDERRAELGEIFGGFFPEAIQFAAGLRDEPLDDPPDQKSNS